MSGNWNNNRNDYGRNQRSFGNGYRQQKPKKSRSGASSGTDKNGKPYVNGWRVSRRHGLIAYFASPYKDTQEIKSGTGRIWHTWILKITIRETGEESVRPCLYDPQSRRVFCKDLNVLLSPQTRRQDGSKGYCGKYL